LHGGLRQGRAQSAAPPQSRASRAALLVYGGVRSHRDAGGYPNLRLGDRVLEGRIDLLSRRPEAQPHRLRSAARHADALPHRRLPGKLFRHRQLRAALRGDAARFHALLRRVGEDERSLPGRKSGMSDDALNNDIENPMATDGFEFVEFGSPDPQALARHFEAMGFAAIAKHRAKDVMLYRQGDINFLLNAEPGGFAEAFAGVHGPSVCAFAFRVQDAAKAQARAIGLGARPVTGKIGPME